MIRSRSLSTKRRKPDSVSSQDSSSSTCVWTVPSLDSPGTRERSSHQYSMKLYVCMLHLFLSASLCECCAFVLPSSASFLSPSPFALAHLWWSAHVVPPGVSLLLFASVPVSSRCTLLKLHLALSLLVVACTFFPV